MTTSPRDAVRLPATDLYINGTWREAASGRRFPVIDPATEGTIAEVAQAGIEDIDRAVAAARRQFDGGEWSRLSGVDRGRLLVRVAELIEREVDDLAAIEALEVGKPVFEPREVDVPYAAETFRHFAGWADKLQGQAVPLPRFMGRSQLAYTVREPVGVVGAITPWNAPTMIASWKIAPALAAGCCVILKPPEDAPLTALRLAELIEEAGVPAGAFNVVPGLGAEAGAALVEHPGVDKVSFTGSPGVGAEIARVAGAAFKRLTLELGGKSPQLVFPDADLERLAPVAAAALFANQGEVCAAGTRVLVHEDVRDEVVEALAAAARAIVVGDPFEEGTEMGALINERQLQRVLGYVEKGKGEGAELIAGGARLDRPGYFVEPTIFAGHNGMTIAREEIFGPVGTVIGFRDEEEAIRLANETHYGLNAVVWTEGLTRAHRVAAALRVGKVWVNGWGPPDPRLPWGGVKSSGIGRELGRAGIEGNSEEKVVTVVL
ncbi:MAG: aldehyde dehydrogenase family protein [Solirubrobacterales bacterium]